MTLHYDSKDSWLYDEHGGVAPLAMRLPNPDEVGQRIVRCVNAHDDLVVALENIRDMILGCPNALHAQDSLPQMILHEACVALARARSEGE